MSRIYFHSPSGEAELRGSERAWMGGLVNDIALGILDPDSNNADQLMRLVAPGHYLHAAERAGYGWVGKWQETFRLAWGGIMSDGAFVWRGHRIDAWTMNLNTALQIGADPLKLAARLHAQCEMHAWVDGPNRTWLADIINEGLKTGLFRGTLRYDATPTAPAQEVSQGWEEVAALLRSRDDEPVVTSYSVCEQFPDSYNTTFDPAKPDGWIPKYWDQDDWDALSNHERDTYWAQDGRGELYNELPVEEQWRYAMEWLRAQPGMLEMTPDTWSGYHFGNGLSVLDLKRGDWERRLDKAFEVEPETVEVG